MSARIADQQFALIHGEIKASMMRLMQDPALRGVAPEVFFAAVLSTVSIGAASCGVAPRPLLVSQVAAADCDSVSVALGRGLMAIVAIGDDHA